MNGYFQLNLKENGTFIHIYPPKDGGEFVNVNELAEYLQRKGIAYDIKELNNRVLLTASGGEFQLDTVKRYQEREMLIVKTSANKMEAFVRFYPPSFEGSLLSKEDIYADMQTAGVKYGFLEDIINLFLENRVYCTDLLLATGKEVRHGTDARIEYFFNTDLRARPTLNEDGSVDFFQLNTMNRVNSGDLLARLIPEDMGESGINVCGETVKPRDVKRLSLKYGRNISISEDRREISSLVNGHVELVDDKVFVSDVYQVENVDTSTGNIKYEGNVQIGGNVCSNFSAIAKGNIEVRGVVEGAYLEAGGDIIIARGMNGMGKGVLRAGGNVISKFIENGTVSCGGFVETESILHSKVMARTEINVVSKKGFITGGVVSATNSISVKTLGSPMGADTVLELGVDPTLKERYQELREKIDKAQKNMRQMQPVLTAATQKMAQGIAIAPDQMKYIQELAKACQQLQDDLSYDTQEFMELEELFNTDTVAQVIVKDVVYSGTKIAISGVSMVIKDNYKYCRFIKSRGEIKMVSI